MLFNHNHFNWALLYGNFNVTICFLLFCVGVSTINGTIVTLESRLKRSNSILLIADSNVTIVPFMVEKSYTKHQKANRNVEIAIQN